MGYFSSSLYFSVLCKISKISTFRFFALIRKVSGRLKRKTYTFFFFGYSHTNVNKSEHLFGGYYGARYHSRCFYILTHLIFLVTL